MNCGKSSFKFYSVLFVGTVILTGSSFARVFTSKDGRTLDGTVMAVTDDSVILRLKNGNRITVPVKLLVSKDVLFLDSWGKQHAKERIPKVDIKINSNRKDRKEKNGYDDREGQVQFEILIENREQKYDLEGAKATLIVFGDYLYNRDEGMVMERKEFGKIDIPEGKKTMISGDLIKYEYDKEGYQHGVKYKGYLFVLKTAIGKVILIKGSSSNVISKATEILELKEGDYFQAKTYKKLKSSSRRPSSTLR